MPNRNSPKHTPTIAPGVLGTHASSHSVSCPVVKCRYGFMVEESEVEVGESTSSVTCADTNPWNDMASIKARRQAPRVRDRAIVYRLATIRVDADGSTLRSYEGSGRKTSAPCRTGNDKDVPAGWVQALPIHRLSPYPNSSHYGGSHDSENEG